MLTIPARRLILLLAALTALLLAGCAGIATASTLHALAAQDRVGAFTPAAPTPARSATQHSPCSRPGSVVSGGETAVGFCVAAEGTAAAGRELAPIAGGAPILGEGGVQVPSRTLLRDTGQGFRIDVENPAPGVRPGQLHLQDVGGVKYIYDFEANQFEGLPPGLARQVVGNPEVDSAIAKARDYLNVPQP